VSRRLRAERPNQVWAFAFQFDQTADGRALKQLNIIDEFTREALVRLVRRSIDADTVVATLQPLIVEREPLTSTCGWTPARNEADARRD
jgi:transposase InsO family protein